MGNAGSGAGKQVNFPWVKLHTMRMPDIIANPFDSFDIFARTHAKAGKAIVNIFTIFGQMRMHANLIGACHMGGFPHQIHADRKGRTRGKCHTMHGVTIGIVMRFDQTLAIRQNRRFGFGQAVRRKPAF